MPTSQLLVAFLCFTSVFLMYFNGATEQCMYAQANVITAGSKATAELAKQDRANEFESLDCSGVVERRGVSLTSDFFLVADIVLSPLEAGKKYRLNITVANPYDEAIEFSTIAVGCGCAKFESAVNEIPAFGRATFVMHLDVPNEIVEGRAAQVISFSGKNPEVRALIVRIEYPVDSSFGFLIDRVNIEISKSENVATSRIPVAIVPPMTLEQLELQASENLKDVSIRLIRDDPDSMVPYVQVEVARRVVSRNGIMGEVSLWKPGTALHAHCVVCIKHQDLISLRPESLRMSRDNTSNSYEARAILRVKADEEPEQREIQNDTVTGEIRTDVDADPPEVGVTIDGVNARVLVKPLGRSGIYRLTIVHNGPLGKNSDGTSEVRWRIKVNGEEQIIESKAFFQNLEIQEPQND